MSSLEFYVLPKSNACKVASVSNRSRASVIAKERLLLDFFEVIVDNNFNLMENLLGVIGIDDSNMYKILTVSSLKVEARRAINALSFSCGKWRAWVVLGLGAKMKVESVIV